MSYEMPGPIPNPGCQCYEMLDALAGCCCGDSERALRAGVDLTDAQREWCRSEVAKVEGFSAADCDGLDDAALGKLVIEVWTEFCRDKGLL